MGLPLRISLDEIFSQLALSSSNGRSDLSRKVLFWGEGAGEISSYIAGWMAGQGIDVVVLDGANRFDPYMVSSFAKKVSFLPENLLKRIRIARAFTCYQMATLVEEKLVSLLQREGSIAQRHKPWVILLGPITTFLDEDVPDREIRPLFDRVLRKVEGMAMEGIPFFLFQPLVFSENRSGREMGRKPPFAKRGRRRPEPDYGAGRFGGLVDSRRAYLTRRLFQISDMVWKIGLDDQGPKMVLEKELTKIADCKLRNLRSEI